MAGCIVERSYVTTYIRTNWNRLKQVPQNVKNVHVLSIVCLQKNQRFNTAISYFVDFISFRFAITIIKLNQEVLARMD